MDVEDSSFAAAPAKTAVACAAFGLAAPVGAFAVLTAPNGNIRGSLVFWVLAAAYGWWFAPVLRFKASAMGRLPLALALGPALSALAALCAAGGFAVRDAAGTTVATPFNLGCLTAASALLSGAGYVALRKSGLPGGGRTLPPHEVERGLAALATPAEPIPITLWGVLGSLWFVGVLLNGCWLGALSATVLPATLLVPVAVAGVLTVAAAFVVYYRCYRKYGKTPTLAARNALARFYAFTLAVFAAFPCVQALLVSPRLEASPGGAQSAAGLDEIALLLALVPACAVAYALYRLMRTGREPIDASRYRRS
jgi:hypothetical protein